MYIMAGIPTTLALEACCARHIIMRTAQHTSNNARSLCGGFLAIFNNQSRFNPFKYRAHPAQFNHSTNSCQSVSGLMVLLFFFSNSSS
jgi:hypothetical protein